MARKPLLPFPPRSEKRKNGARSDFTWPQHLELLHLVVELGQELMALAQLLLAAIGTMRLELLRGFHLVSLLNKQHVLEKFH